MVITEALQQPQELDFKGYFLHDEETSVSGQVIYFTESFFCHDPPPHKVQVLTNQTKLNYKVRWQENKVLCDSVIISIQCKNGFHNLEELCRKCTTSLPRWCNLTSGDAGLSY